MASELPEEALEIVEDQIAIRQAHLQQLNLLYNNNLPNPKVLVAHGADDTCVLDTVLTALRLQSQQHVVVDCKECLSQRHLLSKIFARCVTLFDQEDDLDRFDRLDSINALVGNLKRLQLNRNKKIVLIILSADRQRGAGPTLLPALARLGTYIPTISVILTSSSPRPLTLNKTGVPYLHFPPYTRDEAIQLLLRSSAPLLPSPRPELPIEIQDDAVRAIYSQFVTVLYDTLIAPTTSSQAKYEQTVARLWPRFIWPMVSGEKLPGRASGIWDFARLLSRNRALFQNLGEAALQEHLIEATTQPVTFEQLLAASNNGSNSSIQQDLGDPSPTPELENAPKVEEPPLLKYLPTILLLSCYLASHTHPKHDIVLFSRLSTASSTNRRKKKYLARSRAGGISKVPSKSPKKKANASATADDGDDADFEAPTPAKTASATPKKERADRSMRAIFEKTSNIARPFTLERVLAILRAIHPDGIKIGTGIADRIYVELGELERLRLVVRADAGRAGGKVDPEDVMEEKWKCVVGRDWVVEAGRRWSVSLEGYEVE